MLTGVMLALAFPAIGLYPLAWVALVPLLWRTRTTSPRETACHFVLAGFVFHVIVLQWLLSHFYWVGGAAFLGHQLLCLYLALHWGVMGWLWAWLKTRRARAGSPLVLAILWPAMEYAQATLFTGFGWSALAYSQGSDLLVLQWASLGGTGLLATLIVAVNALLAEVLRGPRRSVPAAGAAVLLLAAHVGGMIMLGRPDYESKPLKVAIFQANFPQEMKLDPEFALEMAERAAEKSRHLARHEQMDLLVWPESLLTEPLSTPGLVEMLQDLARETNCALFTGATRVNDASRGWLNSSILVDRTGAVTGHYDKIHLAPFGEYLPLRRYLPFLKYLVPIEDLEAGTEPVVLKVEERGMGPLICFEVLFPSMAERLRREGADFLAVITNLGWFGKSNALPQELAIARLRAIETRLPLVHSANTGISGIFDPWGRFTAINGIIDPYGTFRELRPDVPAEAMIMARGAGVFALPGPAERPWSNGSALYSWGMAALTVGGVAWGRIARRERGGGKPGDSLASTAAD